MTQPLSNKPTITQNDILKGYVKRYFVQHISIKRIIEVDKKQYDILKKDPLYQTLELDWTISGFSEDTTTKNGDVVYGTRHKNQIITEWNDQKMPGLRRMLQNPLEYFSGLLTRPQEPVSAPVTPQSNAVPLTTTTTSTTTTSTTTTSTTTTTTTATPIVSDNLLVYFDAGNVSSYPGSGTTWTDLSGNGYIGVLANGPTYSSANGGTIVFDGSNDYVSISSLELRRDFSLELWVKINTFSPSLQGLFGQGIPAGNQGMHIFAAAGGINYRMYFNDYNLAVVVNTSQWYQFVFTYSHSSYKKKIYRNGVLLGESEPQGQWQGTGPFRIGHTYSNIDPSEKLNGAVGIFRAYSKVLSDADVLQNYNVDKSRFGL